jgi:hypothetical protein
MGESENPLEKSEEKLLLSDSKPTNTIPPSAQAIPAPPPAQPITPAPGAPSKKPDIGMLSLFVGILLAVFLGLLAMNHVEINWKWSALAYVIFIVGFVWTFLSHGIPHVGKLIKTLGSLSIIIVLGLLASFGVHRQYIFQHTPPPIPPTDTNVEAAVNGLAYIIGTNQSIPSNARIQILTDLYGKETQKQASIKTEISQMTGADLNLLRIERKNQRAIWENEQQKNEIISNQQSEQLKIEDQDKQASEIELERVMVNESLANFDYVIKKFYAMLSDIAAQTGSKTSADFNGSIPTIYSSNLIKNGRFTDSSNTISLGTNDAWNFKFTAEHMLHRTWGLRMDFQGGRFRLASVSPDMFPNSNVTNQNGRMYIELWIEKAPKASFCEKPYYTNYFAYTNLVDQGLRTIIESQDELSPLGKSSMN